MANIKKQYKIEMPCTTRSSTNRFDMMKMTNIDNATHSRYELELNYSFANYLDSAGTVSGNCQVSSKEISFNPRKKPTIKHPI